MGAYLTFNPNLCQVYLSAVPIQGASQWFPRLPAQTGTVAFGAYDFTIQYPGYLSIPTKCIPASAQPPFPKIPPAPIPPAPPPGNPDPPPGDPGGPITGDPPPEACGPGVPIELPPEDGPITGPSWWQSGDAGPGGTDGSGVFDTLAQPLIMGMTPLPTYSSDKPVYTQKPYFEVRVGDKHAIADAYHEGTGAGLLVLHPPELTDLMLHGSGVNQDSRWSTDLSASTLLMLNSERADGSTGDNARTYFAFGAALKGSAKPANGIYFDYDPSTGVLNIQHTDANGSDTTVSSGVTIDGSAIGGGGITFPIDAPDDTAVPQYSFDGAVTPGSSNAGMYFDQDTLEGPAFKDIASTPQLIISTTGVEIPNKLTVGGLIDPTGLELTPVASNPGGTAANTQWLDSSDSNRLKHGSHLVGLINGSPSSNRLLYWDSSTKLLQDSGIAYSKVMLGSNNLSDLSDDDTAIKNLIGGATLIGAPALEDKFALLDITGAGTGGYTTGQDIYDMITGLTASVPTLDTKIAGYVSGGKSLTARRVAAIGDLAFEARLSPSSTLPVPVANATTVSTLYLHPYKGNRVALYNTTDSCWEIHHMSAAVSKALSSLTSGRPYDVFLYDNSGTLTLEFVAWTNDTTRATALTTQNGVYVLLSDASRRYVGTFYTTASNATSWMPDGRTSTAPKLYIWNYYNRVDVAAVVAESATSWTYSSTTPRPYNNDTTNLIHVVVGVQEDYHSIKVTASGQFWNTSGSVGIGYNSINTFLTSPYALCDSSYCATNSVQALSASLNHQTPIGLSYYSMLERANSGTPAFRGSTEGQAGIQLVGRF